MTQTYLPDASSTGRSDAGERLAAATDVVPSGVSRVIRPGRPGTIKLMRRFGPALQAVRYRYDATGLQRFTTVELLVEVSPVTKGACLDSRFAVRVGFHEKRLRALVRQHGGQWRPEDRVWILSGRAVLKLNLLGRVDHTIAIYPPSP